jgi:uncharacterized protein YprB with RNaseH-like and TPR domain
MFINIIMSTVKIPDGHPSFDKLTLKDTTLAGTTVFPNGAKIQIGNNPASGTIATTGFVRRQIDALVANAPATLDTLRELATSLGGEVNLKSYVDGALALKANKDGSNLTGISNIGGKTITLEGNLTHAGAHSQILRATAATDVTLPTSGTLATLGGSETLTNKTITTSGLLTANNGLTVAAGALIVNGGSINTSDLNETVKLFESAENLYVGGKSSNILIGTDNTGSSTTVTIGASNDSVNILGNLTVSGTTTKVNTTDLEVTDKLITLNKGGNAGSAPGAGFTIEANGQADAAYIKVHSDSAKFAIKAPNLASGVEQYIVTKDGNDDFSARNISVTKDMVISSHNGTSNGLKLGSTLVTATAAELNYLDITTLGTSEASKAVTAAADGKVTIDGTMEIKSLRDLVITSHNGTSNGLKLGSTLVTATAAELNILDGVTATAAELNYLDITTLGTSAASKAVTAGTDGKVTIAGDIDITSHNGTSNGLKLGSTLVTATAAELNILDGVTATKDELNYLDITTLGTSEASKAVTAAADGKVTIDGTMEIKSLRDLVITSHDGSTNGLKLGSTLVTATAAELNILDGVTANKDELNYLDITTLGTSEASKAVTAAADGKVTIAGTLAVDGATTLNSVSVSSLTVGGSSLSFTTLINNTNLTTGNYIVNASGNKTVTLPASATAGNLITIYSPSYSYTLANGSTNAAIAANTVTVCIYTSGSTWVAYANGVSVYFQ